MGRCVRPQSTVTTYTTNSDDVVRVSPKPLRNGLVERERTRLISSGDDDSDVSLLAPLKESCENRVQPGAV
jgi:hypothetical protein